MRSYWHRVGARLSLFAMLMALLGPLISQGTSLAHSMDTPSDMAEMPCDDAAPGMEHGSHQHACTDHGLALWEKCGYCTLLFQHPPLTESQPFINRLGPPLTLVPLALFASEQVVPPVFPGARTRAPPTLYR